MSVEATSSQVSDLSKDADGEIRRLDNAGKLRLPRAGLYPIHDIPCHQRAERQRACLDIAALINDSHGARESQLQTVFSKHAYNGETLSEFLSHPWLEKKGRQERIQAIDASDIEMVTLWMWLLGNTEGQEKNILVYPKNGLIYRQPIYGLQIIECSHFLPENNSQLFNTFPEQFPHISSLSSKARDLILNFPLEKAVAILQSYHLDTTVNAFSERVKALQSFIRSELTIQEIGERFNHLDKDFSLDLQLPFSSDSHPLTQQSQWQRV